MGIREVGHVNVVAKTGAVRRRIVVPEHAQSGPARRRFERAGNEVDLGLMVFAQFAVGIRAGGVEVPQRRPPQADGALEMRNARSTASFVSP